MRPEKIEIFLAMAYTISRLSHDSQTKHGCIITDENHRILGCGYNGFPRGCDDMALENKGYTIRPAKYPWMIHAERNAVSNCEHRPENGTAYITGKSCTDCIMHLWQNGITTAYMMDRTSSMLDDKQARIFDEFISQTGMRAVTIKPSLQFLLPMIKELESNGFIEKEETQMEHLLEFVK